MRTKLRIGAAAAAGAAVLALGACHSAPAAGGQQPGADATSDAPTDGVGGPADPSGEPSAQPSGSGSAATAALLRPGARLTAGQTVRSPNGRYTLVLQPDGNLVLVDDAKQPRWSAQTFGNPGAYASFQHDGDLVVYAKGGSPLWHTATGGQGAFLAVQDDGDAVVYRDDFTGVWSSRAERVRLYPGQQLLAGQLRRSADGRYTLVQYPDGNLVVVNPNKLVIWSSQTSGNPGAYTKMQADGNLVVYSSGQQPLWSSATAGNAGASVMVNADGNVVVVVAGNGTALWGTQTDGVSKVTTGQRLNAGQSRTSPHGAYTLLQQPDGNLVLRASGGTVVWSSRTYGHGGAYTKMQADGNLVVYDQAGTALWSARTTGKGATYLMVQDDGNAVLYTVTHQPVWASKTS